MIYVDESIPGQTRVKATMVKEGDVWFLENDALLIERNTEEKKARVVTLMLEGVAEKTYDTPYGVVYVEDGKHRTPKMRFKTAAQATGAAEMLCYMLDGVQTFVVYYNKKPKVLPKIISQEDDPEGWAEASGEMG